MVKKNYSIRSRYKCDADLIERGDYSVMSNENKRLLVNMPGKYGIHMYFAFDYEG